MGLVLPCLVSGSLQEGTISLPSVADLNKNPFRIRSSRLFFVSEHLKFDQPLGTLFQLTWAEQRHSQLKPRHIAFELEALGAVWALNRISFSKCWPRVLALSHAEHNSHILVYNGPLTP